MRWMTGVRFSTEKGIFLFVTTSRPFRDPCSLLTNGNRVIFPGENRPDRESDHSSASGAEVKNAWSFSSSLQYVFVALWLIKQRANFTCVRGGILGCDAVWTWLLSKEKWVGRDTWYIRRNENYILDIGLEDTRIHGKTIWQQFRNIELNLWIGFISTQSRVRWWAFVNMLMNFM
jgi:hypothetical protein